MQCACGGETVNKTTQRDLKPEANFDECRMCGRVGNMVWYQPKPMVENEEVETAVAIRANS